MFQSLTDNLETISTAWKTYKIKFELKKYISRNMRCWIILRLLCVKNCENSICPQKNTQNDVQMLAQKHTIDTKPIACRKKLVLNALPALLWGKSYE